MWVPKELENVTERFLIVEKVKTKKRLTIKGL